MFYFRHICTIVAMFHKDSEFSVGDICYLFLSAKTVQGVLTKLQYDLTEISGRVD
jgi:hypothetical protein